MIWDGFLLGVGLAIAALAIRYIGVLGVGYVLVNYGLFLALLLSVAIGGMAEHSVAVASVLLLGLAVFVG